MKKVINVILFVLTGYFLQGQTLAPVVIASSGAEQTAGGFTLSSTVGEIAVTTLQNNNYLTQGFHQWPKILLSVQNDYSNSIDVNVFPNPFSEYIYVSFTDNGMNRKCQVFIYNMYGQQLGIENSNKEFGSNETIKLDLEKLAKGAYFIRVVDSYDMNIYSDFKVIKIR